MPSWFYVGRQMPSVQYHIQWKIDAVKGRCPRHSRLLLRSHKMEQSTFILWEDGEKKQILQQAQSHSLDYSWMFDCKVATIIRKKWLTKAPSHHRCCWRARPQRCSWPRPGSHTCPRSVTEKKVVTWRIRNAFGRNATVLILYRK